ncbi:MAG TPA: hypothetical protein VE197_12210 [Mycobacterium sp.]|nr:hypothetical protein [Mycobacterium sp.]
MAFPLQRISYITLGARDMVGLRRFYRALGWQERPGSDDEFTTYQLGSVVLALFPIGLLGAEAAPGEPLPHTGWNGMTLGINVESAQAVDEMLHRAVAAGARAIGDPVKRDSDTRVTSLTLTVTVGKSPGFRGAD